MCTSVPIGSTRRRAKHSAHATTSRPVVEYGIKSSTYGIGRRSPGQVQDLQKALGRSVSSVEKNRNRKGNEFEISVRYLGRGDSWRFDPPWSESTLWVSESDSVRMLQQVSSVEVTFTPSHLQIHPLPSVPERSLATQRPQQLTLAIANRDVDRGPTPLPARDHGFDVDGSVLAFACIRLSGGPAVQDR